MNAVERQLTEEQLQKRLDSISVPNIKVLIKIKKEGEFIDPKKFEKLAYWDKNKLVGLDKIPVKEQERINGMLPYPGYFYYCDKSDVAAIKAMVEAEKTAN